MRSNHSDYDSDDEDYEDYEKPSKKNISQENLDFLQENFDLAGDLENLGGSIDLDMVVNDTLRNIKNISLETKEIKNTDASLKETLLNILKDDKISNLQKTYFILNEVISSRSLKSTLFVENLEKELRAACRYPEVYAELKKINDEPRKRELMDQLIKITNKYFDYLTEEKIKPQESRFKIFSQGKITKYEKERNRIVTLHGLATSLQSDPTMEKLIELKTEFNRWKSHLKSQIAKSSVDSLGKGKFAKDMQQTINIIEEIFIRQEKDLTNESKMRSNVK